MKTTTKWLLAAGLSAGAGVWIMQPEPAGETTLEISEARASNTRTSTREEGCTFLAGESLAYELATNDRAKLDLSGLPAGAQPVAGTDLEVSTRARLELRAMSVDPKGAVLLGRFAEIDAQTVSDDDKLRAPFLLRVAANCTIDGFAYKRGVDPGYARVQQALLHELTWAWPDNSDEFQGRNANGEFVATVKRTETDGRLAFTHSIQSFEPWSRGDGAIERVTQSFVETKPGDVAWFQDLQVRAKFEGPYSKVEHTARATYLGNETNSLVDVSGDESEYVWADLLPTEIPLREQQPPSEKELLALAQARKLTVDEAVDQYVARATNPSVGIQDTWPDLTTFLEAKPEAAAEIIEKMKRAEMPAEATMGAYIALGNARTPEAKQALEAVMRDDDAPVIERSRAILALIDRQDVGVELAEYLGETSSRLVGDTPGERILARQSMLALGAMSGRKAWDAETKETALREISRQLEATRDKSAAYQRPVFGALANVGDPETLKLVAEIPTHADPDVREAAAIVFRRMPPAESADFAAQWLAVETNPNVKRKLWQTLELQTFDARANYPESVLRFAIRDLREKPGPITRKALVRLLARAKIELDTNGSPDELGIEDLFVELMPYEFDQKSGFEQFMHDAISPERRDAVYLEVARAMETRGVSGGASEEPAKPGILLPPTIGAGAGEKAQ